MKTPKLNFLLILFISILSVGLSSCTKDNLDSSNGTDVGALAVPNGFDWATIKSAQITVIPADNYNAQYYYTIAVYGENPLFNSAAPLLAKCVVKGGSSYVANLVLPTSTNVLYIRQIDPSKNEIIQSVEVLGLNMVCDFNSNSVSVPNAMPLLSSLRSAKVVVKEPTPAGAIVLTSKSGDVSWTDNKNYVIPVGQTYTGKIDLGQNSSLYIEGTYSLSDKKKTFNIAYGGKLVIQSTGKFQVSSDNALSFFIGQINNYGTLIAAGKFALTSKSTMYNIGTMTFTDFSSSNADNLIVNDGSINGESFSIQSYPFTNNGSFNVSNFEVTSTASFINNGSVEVKELVTNSGSKIYNNCHINVTDLLDLHGTSYFGYKGSLLQSKDLVADGTTFTMSEASILDVETAEFSTWRNYLNGVGSDYALARFGKVDSYKKAVSKNITYQGKMEIECSDHITNDKNNPFWVVEGANVRWSAKGASTTNIPSTGCNEGGNVVVPIHVDPPTDPNFPIVVNLTTNYSFLMEDNWPWLGDYDLNDLVVDLTISYLQDENNKALSMSVVYKLRAVGASKRIAAAFQLDNISPNQISSVSYKEPVLTGKVFAIEKGGLEIGQTKAVVPLFDDAHLLLNPATGDTPSLLNTIIGNDYYAPVFDTIKIVFANPIDPVNISIANLNFFIVTDAPLASSTSAMRSEVHLSGFKPTDKADPAMLLGGVNYTQNGANYRTKENMMWGLLIPTSFKYAAEWKDITTVYPQFTQWCTSGGVDNTFWYEYPTDKSGYLFTK